MAYTPTDWVDGVTPVNAANLDKIEAELALLDSRPAGGGAASGEWSFNATASEPPGSGQVRLNNADQTLASKLWINGLTAPGADVMSVLRQVKTGEQIYVQDKSAPDKWRLYAATGNAVDKSTYVEVSANYIKGGNPLTALPVLVSIIRAGGGADLTYEGDYVGATQYQDGDVVVKDGIAYLCVGGPTTAAPNPVPWGPAGMMSGYAPLVGGKVPMANLHGIVPGGLPILDGASKLPTATIPMQPQGTITHSVATPWPTGQFQAMLFDTAVSLRNGMTKTATGLVVPTAGDYLITTAVEFEANATGERVIHLIVGGTAILRASQGPFGGVYSMAGSVIYGLGAGSEISLYPYQVSGVTLNLTKNAYSPLLSAVRLETY